MAPVWEIWFSALSATLLSTVQGSFREWWNSTSFGLNDLEALVTVAHEAKEWIATHALKRCNASHEASGLSGASFDYTSFETLRSKGILRPFKHGSTSSPWCNFPGERHSKPRQSKEGSTTGRHCIWDGNAVVVLVKVRFRYWLNVPVSNDLARSHSSHRTQVSFQ